LNDSAKLNNDLNAQELKKTMIKEALEAGVPGMENEVANFMKQQITRICMQ
jgi:hypothetical protein